ncbi:MAG: glycosyltransferase family 4 protein [bacterium]|nr:glycosyltransferase family 4 protein [bacterium]
MAHLEIEKPTLRFLMIGTFYPPYSFGGDGISLHRLCNELAARGHTIDVVHCRDAYEILEKRGPKGVYPNHENIRVYSLKSPVGFLSPLLTQQTGYALFKRKKIQALIAENSYDVIHYQNISLIGLDAFTFGDAIKLYQVHEFWLVCPMHVLWKYNREICVKRNCFRCQIQGKRPVQWWRYTKLMQRALSHIDRFLSPSRFAIDTHHEFGLDLPMTHLPNFLPRSLNHSQPSQEPPIRHERPYFLFVGRLEKIKGLQHVIPVFRRYSHADLLVAGDGAYAAALQNLAQNIPNVKFLGRVSYQQLQGLYRNACAVIVSSICYEIFPLILPEAFAERTPVIVNNAGSLPEIVRQSGGGFIYNAPEELFAYLEKFRLSPRLRDELGNKGYQAYLKYWTEAAHIDRYYQLIKEIAERKKINTPGIKAL